MILQIYMYIKIKQFNGSQTLEYGNVCNIIELLFKSINKALIITLLICPKYNRLA